MNNAMTHETHDLQTETRRLMAQDKEFTTRSAEQLSADYAAWPKVSQFFRDMAALMRKLR